MMKKSKKVKKVIEAQTQDPELELLDDEHAAPLFRVKPWTLKVWRAKRKSPPYVKIGRFCYYRRIDVKAWLAGKVVQPSSDVQSAS